VLLSVLNKDQGSSGRTQAPTVNNFDVRIYLAILFFRWQTIAVCFLYALLAAVLYVHLAPKTYLTACKLLIHRDPNLQLSGEQSPWSSISSHIYLLQSEKLRLRVARELAPAWGEQMGSIEKMALPVAVGRVGGFPSMLQLSVKSRNSAYGELFLTKLLEEHQEEWQSIQSESARSATRMLEEELTRLEEKIRLAEDDLIEYQRLHDIARVDARASMEAQYLSALMQRRNQLTTELMLLEAQFPLLKDANPAIIGDVSRLTRETGAVQPVEAGSSKDNGADEPDKPSAAESGLPKPVLPAEFTSRQESGEMAKAVEGWHNLRTELGKLQEEERDLASKFKPEHPQLMAVRKKIGEIQKQLRLGAEVEMGKLRDRHKALTIQLNALESAEYKWQAKNLLASQRQAELNRISSVVGRFENNYNTLYSRLHDMKVSEELKAEHFRTVESVATEDRPVWPDPLKILGMALVLGLGLGLGLAVTIQAIDNKIQSIHDVEGELNIPFLGGVPYWAHSGLEKTIRPIVTEEQSAGAVEAYRAVRTNLLNALEKVNEKVVIVTSADSREGKTLTALNVSLLVAQLGKKVLLVDMDIRRGRLHRSLGLPKEPGVTQVLRGLSTLSGAVVHTRFENLDLVPCGGMVDNAAELLHRTDLCDLFREVRDQYDYIFIDSSPVLRVTDTVVVANQKVGVVLYVARVNHTPKPMIRYSLGMLEDARVLGLVMNSIEMHRISSLYYSYLYPNYSYYSNAYEYGYNYQDYYGEGLGGRPRRRRRGGLAGKWDDAGRWIRKLFLPMG
jgi:capsular exopolysaccharide synthesis family protein